jgi:hypothetical protein
MYRETGNPNSAIWLLGDSNPKSENDPERVDPQHSLTPLDRRHPTRHNIWTPILDVLQREVFVACKSRLNDSDLYIRNAVGDPGNKSDKEQRGREVAVLRDLLNQYRPPLVLAFGRFANEFARHALRKEDERVQSWTVWSIKMLADEFARTIHTLTGPDAVIYLESVNVLPLLHAIGARQFRYCHREFSSGTGNYFKYAGELIASILIKHRAHRKLSRLWM